MGTGCSSERSASLVQLNKDNIPNFKVVLIGDPGVGKTNISLRYTRNQFDYSYRPTRKVNIENVVRKLNVPSNVLVSVTLWDMPGFEDIDLRSTYYKNADAAIVVVDMSDEASIEQAPTWRQDFLEKASRTKEVQEVLPNGIRTNKIIPVSDFDPSTVPLLLLGNKYDIVEDKIRQEEVEKMLDRDEESNPLKPLADALEAEEREEAENRSNKDLHEEGVHREKEEINVNEKADTGEGKDDEKDMNNTQDTEDDANLADLIDRDEDEEEDEKELLFTPQRGQHPKQEAPPCVKQLEEIQLNNDFVGRTSEDLYCLFHEVGHRANFLSSILVSAKDKDGSVDSALQSLVRHLLDKTNIIPKQLKKPVEKKQKKKNVKRIKDSGFQPLKKCGVKELDQLFERTNIVLRRVFSFTSFYEVALHKLRQECADAGVIHESKASLEDCIEGMRRTVEEEMNRQIQLEEEENFPRLHFHVDEEEDKRLLKQMKMFLKLMDDFHHEYCAVCRAILRDTPTLESLLEKLDSRIAARAEEMWESLESGTQERGQEKKGPQEKEKARERARIETLCDTCEKSRARIAHARLKVKDNVKVVENAREKIKAALLW